MMIDDDDENERNESDEQEDEFTGASEQSLVTLVGPETPGAVCCIDGVWRIDTPEQAEQRKRYSRAVRWPHRFRFNGLPYAQSTRRGRHNTIGRRVREAIMAANEIIGRDTLKRAHKRGDHDFIDMCVQVSEEMDWSPNLVAFFVQLWRRQPKTYGAIVGRLMPLQLTGADGSPLTTQPATRQDLIDRYIGMGIPVPDFLREPEDARLVEGVVDNDR